MSASQWWATPLPQGWEAKYDAAQRRYFFINHVNHTTTWEDPRQKIWQEQQAAAAARLQPSPRPSPRPSQSDSIPMQDFSGRRSPQPAKLVLESNIDSPPMSKINNYIAKLNEEFTTADEDIIRVILIGVNYNYAKAKDELLSLGYTETSRSRTTSPQEDTNQKQQTSPESDILSDGERNQIEVQLQSDFPSLGKSIIEMALEATGYDKNKAAILLTSMALESDPSPLASEPSSSRKMSEIGTSSLSSIGHISNVSSNESPLSPKALASPLDGFSDHKSNSQKRSESPKPRAVRGNKGKRNRSASPKKQASAQPSSLKDTLSGDKQVYTSKNRSVTSGSNASFAKGSDKSLLIDDYINITGPQPSNRNGPQQDNYCGPGWYNGPDSSLAIGPNPSLVSGPVSSGYV